jgi:hypothetical protein
MLLSVCVVIYSSNLIKKKKNKRTQISRKKIDHFISMGNLNFSKLDFSPIPFLVKNLLLYFLRLENYP